MRAIIKTGVTKRTVDVMNMREEDIDILDIAYSLAQVNRFGGHVVQPISVAYHSVYVSLLAAHAGPMPERQGLLHDASEAYLGDVTKWLKEQPSFAAYREAEDRLQRMILRKYGCDEELHPGVLLADRRVCVYEAERGGMTFDFDAPGYEPTTIDERRIMALNGWRFESWAVAREMFLSRFRHIFGISTARP